MSGEPGPEEAGAEGNTTGGDRELLAVENLVQRYTVRSRRRRARSFQAVAGVSFEVARHETLGIVGETGCGKSSLARAVVQMERPAAGRVVLQGVDLAELGGKELREARRHLQMVFQDPYSSLDPRWRVADLVAEPLALHQVGTRSGRRERAYELLDLVGLDPARIGARRSREISGGECQRVAIARALALSPELVVLDEAVSSLDRSVQAQVLNLLETLRAELGLAYVFIGHDLRVVRHVSDRIAVMYLGKFCELGDSQAVYETPHHPYTARLLAAVPNAEAGGDEHHGGPIDLGELPSPLDPPSGCRFRTRCPQAQELCSQVEPLMTEVAPGRMVACHFPLSVPSPGMAEPGSRPEPSLRP